MKASNYKRVDFLDGMRGWASLIVVFCHLYAVWLYPPGKYPFSEIFYQIPLRLLVDGRSAVTLFFLLSGFALSYSYFATLNHRALLSAARFRYFRLAVPVFASVSITYIFIKADLIHSQDLLYVNHITFTGFLKYCFYKIFFSTPYHSNYGSHLWTISIEFLGSLMVFSFLALFGTWKYRYFIYGVFIFFLYQMTEFYALFLTGVLLADIYCMNEKINNFKYIQATFKKGNTLLIRILKRGITLLFARLLKPLVKLFAFKYSFDLCMGLCFLFLYQNITNISKPFLQMTFLFTWVLLSANLKTIFSSSLSKFLGKISFALYLTHILMLSSLSHYLYQLMFDAGFSLVMITLSITLITIPVCLYVAYIFTIYIEEKVLKNFKKFLVEKSIIDDAKSDSPIPIMSSPAFSLPENLQVEKTAHSILSKISNQA